MNYGEKIATLRKRQGLTQKELGEALNVSAQAVSKWENNLSQPDIDGLRKMSTLFKVSLDELLCDSEDRKVHNGEIPATSERSADTKNEAPLIGVCRTCKKRITAAEQYQRVTAKVSGFDTQELYCQGCFKKLAEEKAKREREQRQAQQRAQRAGEAAESRRVLIIGFIVGAIAGIAMFVACRILINHLDIWTTLLCAVGMFTLISQVMWGNWISAFFLFFIRSFKAPFGLIFEFSLDGIIWLLTVKLALWVFFGILSIAFFVLGFVLSWIVALVFAPINIPLAIRNAARGELYGLF